MKKNINIVFIILTCLWGIPAYATSTSTTTVNSSSEVLPNLDNNPTNTAVLNDQLRQMQSSLQTLMGGIDINNGTTGILDPSHGGTGEDSSNWTSGDLAYMTSTGVWGHAPFSSFQNDSVQLFTTSGTFIAPSGITTVFLSGVAGGGGGGGNGGNANNGGGGGGGQSVINYPYTVVPGNTYTITIGTGGNTGNSAGGDGTNTVFDALTLNAGTGGSSGGSLVVGAQGTGGSGIFGFSGGGDGVSKTSNAGGTIFSPFGSGGAGGAATGSVGTAGFLTLEYFGNGAGGGGGGGGQTYTASDSITLSGTNFTLTNDSATPGSSKLYGTNSGGTLGWYSQPTGTLTSIATTSPIIGGTITSTGTIGISQSNTSTNGYLSSTDWNIFNNKLSSQWTTSNTHDVYLPNQGNLGIGTANTTGGAFVVMNGNVGIGTWNPNTEFQISTWGKDSFGGNFYFPAFSVGINGNVGIGSVAPEDLLVVHNYLNSQPSANGSGGITIDDDAEVIDPTPQLTLKNGGAQTGVVATTSAYETDYGGYPNDIMGIFTANGMYIDPSGNIGFQVLMPQYAVDISDGNSTGFDIGNSGTGDWYIDDSGDIFTTGTITASPLASLSGVRFVCANTSGQLISQTTACIGT